MYKRTGVIYLCTSLCGVNRDTFTFRVRVSDNAYPEKDTEADVVVNVRVDRYTSLISRGCANRNIDEVRLLQNRLFSLSRLPFDVC